MTQPKAKAGSDLNRSQESIRSRFGIHMRLAIFDVTHWHFPLYLPALADPTIEVVGISDREGYAGRAMGQTLGCPLLDRDELMARDFDFALVFSRHSEMAAVATALIGRRRPFLIEKPCGMNQAEVSRLNQLAKATELFVTVPFILRVSDLAERIRLPAAGYRHLSFRFIVGPISRYEHNGNKWMLDQREAGGGSAMNVGVHFYDLVAALTESPVISTAGQTRRFRSDIGVEELATFTLTMESGQAAHVHTGYLYPNSSGDQREFSFSIAHEEAYLQGYADQIMKKTADGSIRRDTVEYNTDRFYPIFLRDALERCADGRPPLAGLDEAERAFAVIEAGYRSAEQGGGPVAVVARA
jgi:predicted dehydrogenase